MFYAHYPCDGGWERYQVKMLCRDIHLSGVKSRSTHVVLDGGPRPTQHPLLVSLHVPSCPAVPCPFSCTISCGTGSGWSDLTTTCRAITLWLDSCPRLASWHMSVWQGAQKVGLLDLQQPCFSWWLILRCNVLVVILVLTQFAVLWFCLFHTPRSMQSRIHPSQHGVRVCMSMIVLPVCEFAANATLVFLVDFLYHVGVSPYS